MTIANGLSLPNTFANGDDTDAPKMMADLNALLAGLNRALLDGGGALGVNAQSTQIHNVADPSAAQDAATQNYVTNQLAAYATNASLSAYATTAAMNVAISTAIAPLATTAATTAAIAAAVAPLATSASVAALAGAVPAVPTNSGGVGQWLPLYPGGGTSYLPAGGTWAYFGANNGSGFAGVAAGGSAVWSGAAFNFFGFCWRIA